MWEYEVRVPAEVLRFGANRLDLGYAYSAIPAEVLPASKDGRSLAVLFERFSFGGEAPEVVEPAASADGSRLDLPFSSRVSYFLELGAESRLRIGGVELWPEASGPDSLDWRLRLEAVADGEERTTVVELGPRELSQPIEMELPTRQTGQRVRIALAAFSNRPRDAVPAGLTLDLPEAISRDEALAALLAAREQEPVTPPAPVRGPNILVYMIDTLRADHVGAYGYDRATSPNLDSLAADGTLFRSVVAQSSWTKPSVASVLTGLNPQIHGVNGRGDALAPEAVTLAELLWEAGYDTAAIFTNGNLAHMGLGQGYAHYQHLREGTRRSVHVLSDALNDEAFRWLDQRDGSRPFFLYLHATDPHSPYTPPDGFLERLGLTVSDPDTGLLESVNELQRGVVDERQLADLVALYDAEIAFNDEQFGRLVAFLERRGLYDSTLIIVVSDHGEEFFDHGWWQHGKTLYEEQLAVPLIVRFPGGEGVGETVDAIAQHIDIAPTVLDLAGIEAPAELPGRSLRALLGGSAPAGPVNAISYLRVDRREAESVRSAIGKLILHHYDIGGGRLLFDLESDPAERRNLYESRPVLAGYLEASLRAFHLAHDTRYAPEKGEIDAELAARLRDLGYVN
jgi:arylsulfatase A-like enzyme